MFRACCTLLLCLSVTSTQATEMRDQLDNIRQRFDIGAVSWAMVEQERVIELGGLGFHSRSKTIPITEDSLFRVGSLTKLITALSLNRLADQNKLDLDAPLRRYLPDVPLQNPYTTPVTLRMVLEHSAGLQDLTSTEFDYPTALSLTEAFRVAPDARQVQWQPGLHQSYSNAGAGYAGRALEAVTGQNWDHWIQANLLTPLNMTRSTTLHSPSVTRQLVTGYDTDRQTVIPYWHTLFRPFGALNTTARDFSQLLKLLINRGNYNGTQLIRSTTLTSMEAPQSTCAASLGHQYGYGSGLYRWYRDGKLLLGHGGDGDGYLAHFAYNPQSQRGIFVVINAFHYPALRAMRKPLESWAIAPLPAAEISEPTANADQLNLLTGQWQAITHRFRGRTHQSAQLSVELRDGQLYYRQGNRRTVLIPVAENRFRERQDGGATHLFFEKDGQWYWQSDLGNYRRLH